MSKLLVVDDEPKNLKLVKGFLGKYGYEVITAEDGVNAWEILEKSYQEFDVLLFDRMMPNMDGMALTAKVKAHPEMSLIPIIMQTAAAQSEQISEGLAAGVYYYLTKPYSHEVLESIVSAAISDYLGQKKLLNEVNQHVRSLSLVEACSFSLSTLDDVHLLTSYLANFFPEPGRVTLGISELLINAVEHGNLGISYDEKTLLNTEGTWEEEVRRREALPEHQNKKVRVQYERLETEILLTIKDDGPGFDWEKYISIDMARASDNHGRGIAMSKLASFDKLEYRGKGNEVCCHILLNK